MKKLFLAPLLLASVTAFAQPNDAAIGCWNMASRAGEHIQINRNGEFDFNDFNAKTGAMEMLHGTWQLRKDKLSLMYQDRPRQVFTLKKSGKSWSLTKTGGFKFMKEDPSKCQ